MLLAARFHAVPPSAAFHTAGRRPAPFEITTDNAMLAQKIFATLAGRNRVPQPGSIFWQKPWLDETNFDSQG